MLPGDIDLTQNLDFRKQVKKELPQFPATWNGDGKISNKLNYDNFIGNISVSNDYTLTISNTTNDNTRVSIYRYDTDSDIITSSPIVMYRYNNQNTWFEYNTHDYLTTSSTTSSITINKYIEPEKDIFGNIIESKQEQQPKCSKCGEVLMPWEHNYCFDCNNKSKRPIPDTPWENQNKFKYSSYIYYNSDDRIPWETEVYYNESKSQEPICYLADKSKAFIERYLNRFEEDNESYLTNMRWIRVRDAIID